MGLSGGRCSISTTRFTNKTAFSMSWCAIKQAAVHAADGFARATGEVGVALVTSGPGLTNAVTGIATAYTDSIPAGGHQRPDGCGGHCTDAFSRVLHRGHYAPDGEAQFFGRKTWRRFGHDGQKKRFTLPARAVLARWWWIFPRMCRSRKPLLPVTRQSWNVLLQPGEKRPLGPDSQGLAIAAGGQAPYIYTGGGVLLGNACAELRELVDMLGYPSPTP